ncbi:hypothetical protein [cf. Phormidesmis sp. LEGE 11477]|uniref:hypothetical protein n=1 Tax=cf. Phormidesmis sp. LEGE 11477 TaxID=1828680 RepID=UPI00188063CD|nr:hypothetical protein [cf. Phormidesmis sp. LEGE 11477]MBE9060846.1 hypothetical protein [cf. Phormidesmis sp. LEGE 11477]
MRAVPWLSICLVLLANIAFGSFLHEHQISEFIWMGAIVYIVLQCGALSVGWQPVHQFILLGFKSGIGYSVTALVGASLVVVILVWAQISSYFLVMLAAALLLRIDLYTRKIGVKRSFGIMLIVSLLGLGISWLLLEKTGYLFYS